MPNQRLDQGGPAPALPSTQPPPGDGPVTGPRAGVVFTPSSQISASLKRQVQAELDRIPAGRRGIMARVDVETGRGVNAVIAYKSEGGWHAALWAGKSGWDAVTGATLGKVW